MVRIKSVKTAMSAMTLASAMIIGGCANSGNSLTTASLNQAGKQASAQTVNPACISLTAKIDNLRKEGTMDRLAKVAQGKGRATMVKRSALAKAAELDRANAEFQAKCSTIKPATTARGHSPAEKAVMDAAKSAARKKAASTVKTAAANAAVKTAAKASKKQ